MSAPEAVEHIHLTVVRVDGTDWYTCPIFGVRCWRTKCDSAWAVDAVLYHIDLHHKPHPYNR